MMDDWAVLLGLAEEKRILQREGSRLHPYVDTFPSQSS